MMRGSLGPGITLVGWIPSEAADRARSDTGLSVAVDGARVGSDVVEVYGPPAW